MQAEHAFLLRTFGPLTLERIRPDGTAEILLRQGKPLALLLWLLVHEGRPLSRATAAELFWPSDSSENARRSLRQAVLLLRRLLGGEAITGDRNDIVLPEGMVTLDQADFVAETVRLDMTVVLERYRAPFCDGLEITSSMEFAHWILSERERLRRTLFTSTGRRIALLLEQGNSREAARIAGAVQHAEPQREESVRFLVDALVADGDVGAAQRLLDQHASMHALEDSEMPPALEDRRRDLSRLEARSQAAVAEESTDDVGRLGHRLVGRHVQIAELLAAVEQARAGRSQSCVLVGPSGSGKTRLLDELESRTRFRGGRIVRVRFVPGMRDVPWTGLTALVRALSDHPAVGGVSEATAAVLVDLLPDLASRFPAARPLSAETGERQRLRSIAVGDLLEAVSEERLTVLLMDDEQYMDQDSRTVLASVVRRRDLRLLEVSATRTFPAHASSGPAVMIVAALDRTDVLEFIEQAGRLPEEPWVVRFVDELERLSSGVPQAVLRIMRSLVAHRALLLVDGEWRAPDPAALRTALTESGLRGEADLPRSTSSSVLLGILAHWRKPLGERALLDTASALVPSASPDNHVRSLRELEADGLATSRDLEWSVAHDSIAEARLRQRTRAEAEDCQVALIRVHAALGLLTPPAVEHLAMLAGQHDLSSSAEVLTRISARTRSIRATGLRDLRLTQRIAQSAGRPEWEAGLRNQLGWMARRSKASLFMLGGVASTVLGTLVWLAIMFQPRLVVESEPMGDVAIGGVFLVVQPRVGVYDGFGRLKRDAQGTVRVRGVRGVVFGDTVISLLDGRAQFARLSIRPDSLTVAREVPSEEPALQIIGPPFTRSVLSTIGGAWRSRDVDGWRVIRAEVNGTILNDSLRYSVASGDDSLRVALTYEFTTRGATSNYVVGAGPTWMPRESSTIRLAGLPRPVRDAWQTVNFVLPSPKAEGRHFVILAMGAEASVEHLFSQTNWTIGIPVWNDGNDLVDLSPDAISRLRGAGNILLRTYQFRPYVGNQSRRDVETVKPSDWDAEARAEAASARDGQKLVHGSAITIDVRTK